MDTLRTPAALASLVASNLTPLAGILFLGWSAPAVFFAYFIDTFIACGGVLLLVMVHITGNDQGRPFSGWKDWAKAIIGLVLVSPIFGFLLVLPVFFVFGDDRETWSIFDRREFLAALGVQVLMSLWGVARMHRVLQARSDDSLILARRFVFLMARWVVGFFVMITGIASLLGPRFGSTLLVAVYAGASIYFELFSERAERFLRGRNAKPIVFEPDLEQRNRERRK